MAKRSKAEASDHDEEEQQVTLLKRHCGVSSDKNVVIIKSPLVVNQSFPFLDTFLKGRKEVEEEFYRMLSTEMQRDNDIDASARRDTKEEDEFLYRLLFTDMERDNPAAVEVALKELLSFFFQSPSREKVGNAIELGVNVFVFRSMTKWFDVSNEIVSDCMVCLNLFTNVDNCKLNSGKQPAGVCGQLLKMGASEYIAACLLRPFESNSSIQKHSLAVLGNLFWYEQEKKYDPIYAVKFVEEMDGHCKVICVVKKNPQNADIACAGCYLLSILSYFGDIKEKILDSDAMTAIAAVMKEHRDYKHVKTSIAVFMQNVL